MTLSQTFYLTFLTSFKITLKTLSIKFVLCYIALKKKNSNKLCLNYYKMEHVGHKNKQPLLKLCTGHYWP